MNYDDAQYAAYEAQLRPLLTDEFLETLVFAVRVIGWGVDMVETRSFADELFQLAGKEPPATLTALPSDPE